MFKFFYRLKLVFLTVILVVASLVCCDSESEEPLWQIDEYGRFYTQDFSRAQEEVPFQIIAPSYLPQNISTPPNIVGPMEGTHWTLDEEGELTVILEYNAGENSTKGLITIYEYNYPVVPPDPQLNEDYKAFNIGDTEVVICEHNNGILTPDGIIEHPGFLFMWNKDNLYFEVGIYHYDHDEAVKVIESMIE